MKWKTKLNTLVFLLIGSLSLSNCTDNTKENAISNSDAPTKALYPTGNEGFIQDVVLNIKKSDRSNIPDSTFKLYCEALLNIKGRIEKVEILNNFLPEKQTKEVIAAIKETKKWIPAKGLRGENIKVTMILPLAFRSTSYENELSKVVRCENIFVKQKNTLSNFGGNYILLIPLEGCSGCVNFSIDKISQLSRSEEFAGIINELIYPVLTTNRYSKTEMVLKIKENITDQDPFFVDYDRIFSEYLLDQYQPLLVRRKSETECDCTILTAQSVEKKFEELEYDLEAEKIIYEVKQKKITE